jgi:hypothetical protein
MRRNAAIVLGNTGDERAVPALIAALDDASPIVRGATAWALGELAGKVRRRKWEGRSGSTSDFPLPTSDFDVDISVALRARLAVEDNPEVVAEINAAIRTAGA